MKLDSLEKINAAAKAHDGGRVAVAAAHDGDVLSAVARAGREGICSALLFGNEKKIRAILEELGEDAANYAITDCATDAECAAEAVAAVAAGKADFLMKGLLNTTDMLRAVVHKESGMVTDRLLSHVMFYETDDYGKLIADTDGGMNPYPDLDKKILILENAALLMKALGYGRIYASCVCGSEVVSQKIQATVDAQTIAGMSERWDKYDMKVIGPVGLDLAISPTACRHKGFTAEGCGEADILLFPTYEVGNSVGKSLTYFAGARSAGIVLGAKTPIVLVSRADSADIKLASIALATVVARSGVFGA